MTRKWITGTAAGVVLGVAAVVAVDAATQTAEAQAGFTVSPEQLQINQRISQAAVKRSNQSLNYLAPIRTTQSDAADPGTNGVRPLARVPGAGQGWPASAIAANAIVTAKIADNAVATAKIANDAVATAKLADAAVTLPKLGPGQKQYWATVTGTTPPVVTAQSDPGAAITAVRINAGNYRVDLNTGLTGCSFTASPAFDAGAGAAVGAQASIDATDAERVAVRTVDGTNTAVDANFQVQVLC